MRKTGLLLISLLFCVSCTDKHDHKGQTPLVEVDGNFLYKEDLQAVLPAGLSKDYRKALIMHTYQQELISQKLSGEIPEQEIADYYEKNKELFKLDRPLMKGLFIKVPLTAPQLGNVRKWYKTETQDAVEHLEKYSLQNAVKYEYFYDKWVRVADVLDMIPLKAESPEAYMDKNRHIELKDTAFYYFLNISDFRVAGEQEPYEFAQPKVKDMLVNIKRVDFMKQVKDDLYERAVKRKKIINY